MCTTGPLKSCKLPWPLLKTKASYSSGVVNMFLMKGKTNGSGGNFPASDIFLHADWRDEETNNANSKKIVVDPRGSIATWKRDAGSKEDSMLHPGNQHLCMHFQRKKQVYIWKYPWPSLMTCPQRKHFYKAKLWWTQQKSRVNNNSFQEL